MSRRVLLLAAVLAACSGSSERSSDTTPRSDRAPPEDAQTASLRKLRAAQDSAVSAMCERLTDCSIEDAKATMSPAELAKLQPEELAPKARAECEDAYSRTAMSPRQVKVIQGCVNTAETCQALGDCLDQARPAKPAPATAAP